MNLLRLSHQGPTAVLRLEMLAPLVLGLLLAGTNIAWTSSRALHSLELGLLEKQSLLQTIEQAETKPTGQEASRQEAEMLQQRLKFLNHLDSERDHLTTVQTLLFDKLQAQQDRSMKLKVLSWQQGHLSWEGVATSPQAAQVFLKQLDGFEQWHTPPALSHLQSEDAKTRGRNAMSFVFGVVAALPSTSAALSSRIN
jgi:hypothetical protein